MTIPAALTELYKGGIRRVYWQRCDATGDIPHVVGALAVDPEAGVLVVEADEIPGAGKKRDDVIKDLKHRGFEKRFRYVNIGKTPVVAARREAAAFEGLAVLELHEATKFLTSALVGSAKQEKSKVLHDVKEALRGERHKTGAEPRSQLDEKIFKYLDERILRTSAKPEHVVILWGRRTGKKGGLHPGLDSSTTGIVQICSKCRDQKWIVVVAGDVQEAKAPRFVAAGAVYLGEFWRDKCWGDEGLNRIEQVRVFYILKKILKKFGKSLVHVGMRSGGLDAYGFSGQPTLYIIDAVTRRDDETRMGPTARALQDAFRPRDLASGKQSRMDFSRFETTKTIKKRFAALEGKWENLVLDPRKEFTARQQEIDGEHPKPQRAYMATKAAVKSIPDTQGLTNTKALNKLKDERLPVPPGFPPDLLTAKKTPEDSFNEMKKAFIDDVKTKGFSREDQERLMSEIRGKLQEKK